MPSTDTSAGATASAGAAASAEAAGAALRAQLRAAGLRVTRPRVAVLEWLAAHPHATAEQIGRGVRERTKPVSAQAVYDVLGACGRAGLVRWIQPAGHPTRYERRTADNHHHLVCRVCGRVEDVDCATGCAPCLAPSDDRGYTLDEAEVAFWGECADCAPTAAPAAGAEPAALATSDVPHRAESTVAPAPENAPHHQEEPK